MSCCAPGAETAPGVDAALPTSSELPPAARPLGDGRVTPGAVGSGGPLRRLHRRR